MRHSYDHYLGDPWVGRKCGFHFAGENVFASRDVHLLLSAADVVESIITAHCEVAGVKPPVFRQRLCRSLGIVQVSAEHLRSSKLKLAGLIQVRLGAVVPHQTHLEEWNWPADFSRTPQ